MISDFSYCFQCFANDSNCFGTGEKGLDFLIYSCCFDIEAKLLRDLKTAGNYANEARIFNYLPIKS